MRPDARGTLRHILEAAQFVEEDTSVVTFEEFLSDRRIRQSVERNLEIIGEAVNRLKRRDPAIAARITELPDIIGMRNALIHGYDTINYRMVWRAVERSVPVLRREIEALLEEGEREMAEQATD